MVSESFTPFGNRRNPATWSGSASTSDLTAAAGITRQGYTFQTQLGLWMGLNHMNGRVQDSLTGRVLSADTNIPDAANAQGYNRYSYVSNNPLSYIDPSGFDDVRVQDDQGDTGQSEVDIEGSRDHSGDLATALDYAINSRGGIAGSESEPKAVVTVTGHRTSPPGNQPTSEVTVTASAQASQQSQGGLEEIIASGTRDNSLLAVELPPGLEIFIEGQKMNRLPPTYTPEQPVDPAVPRAPVQSPINPRQLQLPGWLPWQLLQMSFRGIFNIHPGVVPPTPLYPARCTPQTCA